ncbi:hypothetical protein [Actinomadura sp. DC4]|uniref:hypothetical protein n=1 Tax=Actinomadura sp. DC4 TaxID=3055069 RepID=UPI0025AED9D4|nr:hypothetical protein [Actinomadura sp. DC4]MDN3356058.1 hypothetical protein [Actinomadura sp. DC4]
MADSTVTAEPGPGRHDPPTDYICLDEWRDDTAVCVCQLPEGHGEDWHECRCGKTWQEGPRV